MSHQNDYFSVYAFDPSPAYVSYTLNTLWEYYELYVTHFQLYVLVSQYLLNFVGKES